MTASDSHPPAAAAAPASGRQWLLFVHQLPAHPSNLRVRTWRRLQQIGALAVKQAVYVLPDVPSAREDFEWLKSEIESAGGEASVFAADNVDSWGNDALVDQFRRSREEAFAELARDAEQLLRRMGTDQRRPKKLPGRREVQQLRERLAAIEHIDFFASAGRDRVVVLLAQIDERSTTRKRAPDDDSSEAPSYQARLWVTRPRPGVDRMASAWLIKRFIDADATFDFAADRNLVPRNGVPFDMYGVEFTHRGELCTFETLCDTFRLREPALTRIAGIVHDLDLKDGRFGAPEGPTMEALIEGLRLSRSDDQGLLADGMTLFEALYRAFTQAAQPRGPRPVSNRRDRRRSPRPPRGQR